MTLIAKENGTLYYSGSTGDYAWWMHAKTNEYQYMRPAEGPHVLVVPVPKNYLEQETKPAVEKSSAKKKLQRAKAKLRTMMALKRLAASKKV
jgi:hypothetical protein